MKEKFQECIVMLNEKIKKLQQELKLYLEKETEVQKSVDLITTIKWFGKLSACRLLAYLPEVSSFSSAEQLAAFVGVCPRQNESGNYQGQTRMSKWGHPQLRKILNIPALSAKRFNPSLQAFVTRLKKFCC
ncbi:MAG: IS110 family transposase [Proteobacteria bacterium]|nr:IS110 family transposase [Pseudomonadota bacterium]